MLLSIFIGIGALGVAAFLVWERNDMARALIEGDLRGRRATNIEISGDWFDFDRHTLTYDVTYTNANGRRVSNRAKVAMHRLADNSVFWQQPLS